MKRASERAFTLIELMIVVAIIALLAAIAIPNVLRARTSSNEAAVIGNLRALVSSLEMARSVNLAYPLNVASPAVGSWQGVMYDSAGAGSCVAGVQPDPDFGPPSFCNTMAGGATAATGLVQGYQYVYTGVAAGTTYSLASSPSNVGTTGTRAFFVDQTGLIRHCTCANAADCPSPATAASAATSASNTIDVAPNASCP